MDILGDHAGSIPARVLSQTTKELESTMKPVYFEKHNKVYAKNQLPYIPLPVYEDAEQGGRVFHCWSLSFFEKIHVLFTGKVWVNVCNFNQPLQPLKLMTSDPFDKEPLSLPVYGKKLSKDDRQFLILIAIYFIGLFMGFMLQYT